MHKNGYSVSQLQKHIARYFMKTFLTKIQGNSILFYLIFICYSITDSFQAKDSNLRKLAYGGSLGRLNHHGRTPLQMRAHHQSHHGSTTLSNQLFKTTAAAV